MISEFKEIENLLKEIDKKLKSKTDLFMIGGAVLLHQGIKPATKDIDIIVLKKEELESLSNAISEAGFKAKFPSEEYKGMELNNILVREDFRIDLFNRVVCEGFSLSEEMAERAKKVLQLDKLTLHLCSNEDIFLFKTLTEREGDLEDCIALAQREINWEVILKELKNQTKTGRKVWITLVGERLDILQERGLIIQIMKAIDELREKYFNELEKKRNK